MIFEEYLKQTFGLNEPIYLEGIQFEDYSRSWIFKKIKSLVDSESLKRFDKGIYYFPEKMPWGYTSLDPGKVVQKKYLSDGENVYGYVTGLSFKNSIGLTSQCPNLLELASNNESARVREVRVGFQRILARRPRVAVTKENANILQFLDLMNIINPKFMDETDQYMLNKYVKDSGVTQYQIYKYAGLFPANAMRNFLESGAAYELAY
jgi:hypothetical protein